MSKYNCNKCEDRKYTIHNGKYIDCVCLKQLKMQNKYNEANIPPIFRDYSWSDFFKDFPKMRYVWKLCKTILKKVKKQERCKFLYIMGEGHSGKQAFISLILKEFINAGLSCKFVSLNELIQMEFNKEDKSELNRIYATYDVVCLRLGTVINHGYARFVLEKFYSTRRNNKKYGIFTSRVDVGANANIYGLEMKKLVRDGRRILKVSMR